MLEFQITQEYLGFSTHLVYLAPLFKETLAADTYAKGKGSTVAKVIDGSLQGQSMTGMAGVANIGNAPNWTHHPFGQANWFAFGRLAWDYDLSSEEIARDWIKMTLTQDKPAVNTILGMMMGSREALVNYQTPLGLNTLSSGGHHYGPQPWRRLQYHHADSAGIGVDRTGSGSNAVEQYFPVIRDSLANIQTCPENLLAWFHHVPWNHKMQSGRTFWEELSHRYNSGVADVRTMQKDWNAVKKSIDPQTHRKVEELLATQEDEAVWWRDACLWYFSKVAGKPVPDEYEKPRYNAQDLKEKEAKAKHLKHYSTQN